MEIDGLGCLKASGISQVGLTSIEIHCFSVQAWCRG